MSADEKQHVLDLIKIKKDRLHVLERQSAAYGLACPPHIQVELDQVKKEIAEHEQQIKESQHARKAVGTAPEEAIDASPGDSEIAYLDLEIEVGLGDGREYPLKVIQSPVGHAAGIMQFPFDKLTLENRLQALQILLLRASGKRRTISSSDEQAVQSFGRDLFNALIIGEIRTCYDKSMQVAATQGRGIRLKLHVQAPNLATLPWEFLYDPRQAEYVCLSPHTSIVRYLEFEAPSIKRLNISGPLRILGMIASPSDLPILDITHEQQRIELAISDLRAQGLVELTWLHGQTWRDLQRAMRQGPWHVFHFIGHGSFDRNSDEGIIALADERGRAHRLSATMFSRLLADHRSLRLVLLNACDGAYGSEQDLFSSTASIVVRHGIPAVLAMQYEITDEAAIEFAHTFYESLADSFPVDAAMIEARKAMSMASPNTVEWGVPVLYMRSTDGLLFRIARKTQPITPSPATDRLNPKRGARAKALPPHVAPNADSPHKRVPIARASIEIARRMSALITTNIRWIVPSSGIVAIACILLLSLTGILANFNPTLTQQSATSESSGSNTYPEQINTIPTDQLITAAKHEGNLNVAVSSQERSRYMKLAAMFKQEYNIDVNVSSLSTNDNDILNRIKSSRSQKEQVSLDIAEIGADALASGRNSGLFAPYKVSNWDTIPTHLRDEDGYWSSSHFDILVFAANRNVVKTMPTDWKELLNPVYHGQIALANEDALRNLRIHAVLGAALAIGNSLDDPMIGLTFFDKLNRSGNFVSVVATEEKIASGETPLIIGWNSALLVIRDSFNANPMITVQVPKKGILAQPAIQVISAYAPHPYAARLWMEYLFSDAGQLFLLKEYVHPSRYMNMLDNNKVTQGLATNILPSDILNQVTFMTPSQLAKAKKMIADNWQSKYNLP